MWDMTHESTLGFLPLVSSASLSVAHGNPAINNNLAKLKTYSLCSGGIDADLCLLLWQCLTNLFF